MVGSQSSDWDRFAARFHGGGTVDGRVSKLLPFGAFVEVAEGALSVCSPPTSGPRSSRVSVRIPEVDPVRAGQAAGGLT